MSFWTASTTAGSIVLTNDNANLTVGTSVNAGGAGSDVTLTTTTGGNVVLTGTTTAVDQVQVNSAGAINGAGLVTAGTVDLNAATGIGNTAALELAASTISADTTSGNIDIDNALGTAVTVSSLTTGTGTVNFDQSGGGAVSFTTASTTAGSIVLTNDNANLTVGTSVNAGGAGSDVTLTTTTGGNVVLTGTTTAVDQVQVNSAGAINGAGLVTAGTVDLNAATGIGNTAALELAASTISADTTSGNIDIDNALGTAVTVSSLTTGTGTVNFDQSGGGAVSFTTASTTAGSIVLTNDNANLTVG